MAAVLLDGEKLASQIRKELKKEIEQLKAKGIILHLVAVQVGENPASRVYIKQQKKSCQDLEIEYELKELPSKTTQDELIDFIKGLNQDDVVTGIILQMPLPSQINARKIQIEISPDKDVEGVHPVNMGRLVFGETKISPCTAQAALSLLKSSGVDLKGKEAVVVGHSEIVGKPIALMLLSSITESATVTVCHIATGDLAFHTKKADIVIVAVGKVGLIKKDMLKKGAIVIDVGINRVAVVDEKGNPVLNEKGNPKKKIVGDVEADAKEVCSYISPVPGGVGPLTVTMLLKNTIECIKKQRSI